MFREEEDWIWMSDFFLNMGDAVMRDGAWSCEMDSVTMLNAPFAWEWTCQVLKLYYVMCTPLVVKSPNCKALEGGTFCRNYWYILNKWLTFGERTKFHNQRLTFTSDWHQFSLSFVLFKFAYTNSPLCTPALPNFPQTRWLNISVIGFWRLLFLLLLSLLSSLNVWQV